MGSAIGLERLDEQAARWLREERQKGLIDVKFFPGCDREVLERSALNEFLNMMVCRESGEYNDITDQIL